MSEEDEFDVGEEDFEMEDGEYIDDGEEGEEYDDEMEDDPNDFLPSGREKIEELAEEIGEADPALALNMEIVDAHVLSDHSSLNESFEKSTDMMARAKAYLLTTINDYRG